MKLSLLAILASLLFLSCQKGYERPDVVLGGSTSTSSSGTLLVKATSKTQGSTEGSTSTYEYDGANRLLKITNVNVDSNNATTTIVYRYARDASGKITSIITNELSATSPGVGYPDSVTINMHYPSGSSNFDYATYKFTVNSITFLDSTTYAYTGSVINNVTDFQAVATATYSPVSILQFSFANSDLVTQKLYDATSSTTPVATYNYEYDSKTAALYTGNEGVLVGQNTGFLSKNNTTKITVIDNSTNTVGATATYTYQYTSTSLPNGGTMVTTPDNKTTALTFTYK